MSFVCNTCGNTSSDRHETRGDGKRVLFCSVCGMGMIENPPDSTDFFYADGYYGADSGDAEGYHDYELTSSHTQLWVQLLIGALGQGATRILDVGCADGTMLSQLPKRFVLSGIEANAAAADKARARGIDVITNDVADPALSQRFGSFDMVSAIATFEHVLDMRGAIETALNLLTAEGLLVLEVPLISATEDNKDWYHGSYEHITYPTVAGMTYLLNSFSGLKWVGFESKIKKFSSSYIAVASRSDAAFARAKELVDVMTATTDPAPLSPEQQQLNLAYTLVRGAETTPERVLALPSLLAVAHSQPLLRRLSQIWYDDTVSARNAEYYEQQAHQWQAAWNDVYKTMVALQTELERRDAVAAAAKDNVA